MEIDYLLGSKEDFENFVDSIGLYDKVAVLGDNDMDRLSSCFFMNQILEAKGIKVNYMDFLVIKRDMIKEASMKLNEESITKVFILDLNVDEIDPEGFEDLRREKDVFLIDHHPIRENLTDKTNIIKTVSGDCVSLTLFALGEGLIDYTSWGWLVCAAVFADYSFKSEKNFRFLQSYYPNINSREELSSSIPGINARKISSALIYYRGDSKHVYELIKERKIDELTEVYEVVEEEVYRVVDDFSKNKKYIPEKDIYFYEVHSKFDILSYVITLISSINPNGNFVFMSKSKDFVKFSARSNNHRMDMEELMKEGVKGIEEATGGGHKAAAAAKVPLEDVEIFKKRVLGE